MKITHLSVGYTCNNRCIYCLNTEAIENLKNRKKPIDRTRRK